MTRKYGGRGDDFGNVSTFDADFWASHIPHLRRRLLRMGFARADVDDLVQDTFVVAQRGWKDRPRARKRHRNWLEGIAWRLGMNLQRRRRRRQEVFDDDLLYKLAADAFDPDLLLDIQKVWTTNEADWQANDREMLLEYFVDGDSVSAIAARHGLARSTVWARLQKLRKPNRPATRGTNHGVKRIE